MDSTLNNIKSPLSHTDSLLNQLFVIEQSFDLQPDNNHFGTAIKFSDTKEQQDLFLNALKKTVIAWVYSAEKQNDILNKELLRTNDIGHAATELHNSANSKFRKGHPQGQFGELLLFNFLQHFFSATPLLRKMNITTSIGHERFGADAIHYKSSGNSHIFYIGESKCYKSKYKFKAAFKESLCSVMDTYDKLEKEMDLYVHEGFLSPELQHIVEKYKNGELDNIEHKMVCLIAYQETKVLNGMTRDEIYTEIEEIILKNCQGLESKIFSTLHKRDLAKITYIIFPLWNPEELLNKFDRN